MHPYTLSNSGEEGIITDTQLLTLDFLGISKIEGVNTIFFCIFLEAEMKVSFASYNLFLL
jgi:hypothetical protein